MKNLNQKVFAIVNKETKEIEAFGLTAKVIYNEWNDYYVGTEDEKLFELQQTFMSQDEIRNNM